MAFAPKTIKAVTQAELTLRNSVFPGAEALVWEKTRDRGFITIPKTMPYICRILDEMSKNQPLGIVYQLLWTYTFDANGFVRLGNLGDLAFAAGFGRERGERTLRDRLRKLDELGFIVLKPHGNNPTGFALIPSPHQVILDLHARREAATPTDRLAMPELREETFNAFIARASDVRAADIKRIQDAQNAPPVAEVVTPVAQAPKPPRRKPVGKTAVSR